MSVHLTPRTKREFRALYERGVFGNKLRTWTTYDALCDSDYHGKVSCRHVKTAGLFLYGQSADLLRDKWPFTESPDNFHFNETPPDDLLLIQGELSRQPTGLDLQYSTERGLALRMAINNKASLTATGLKAKMLLQHYTWPASYDDLMELLDDYPDGAVEFSTFDKAVGDKPHRNTVIWEVRAY